MSRKFWKLVIVALAVSVVVPVMAQQTYTNADLGKLHIAGAYTNDDLETLEPLPVQDAPLAESPEIDLSWWIEEAAAREAEHRALTFVRDRFQAELDYELQRLEIAYSPAGGGFTGTLRTGLRSQLESRLEYLRRQIHLLDWEIGQN